MNFICVHLRLSEANFTTLLQTARNLPLLLSHSWFQESRMNARSIVRKLPRLQFRLSTMLVMVLMAGVLMGLNVRPYNYYFPRPEWIGDLKLMVHQSDESELDRHWRTGVYGWPFPAYPSWNWSGNGTASGQFPNFSYYTSEASDFHIACNWQSWNHKALGFNIAINLTLVALAGTGWQCGARKLFAGGVVRAQVVTS
jgi:hypothetical protein